MIRTESKGKTFAPTDFYQTFVEGQAVRLVTGSTKMVVIDVDEDGGELTVAYGNSDGDVDIITLPTAALAHSD